MVWEGWRRETLPIPIYWGLIRKDDRKLMQPEMATPLRLVVMLIVARVEFLSVALQCWIEPDRRIAAAPAVYDRHPALR